MNIWDLVVYAVIFGVIIYTDFRFLKIFNWNILIGIAFALFVAITSGNILNSLLGGAVGFALMTGSWMMSYKFFGMAQVGMGDIKLGFLIGLVLGFPVVFWSLAVAMVIGGLSAFLLLLTRVVTPIDKMPVGVTMSIVAFGFLLASFLA